LKTYYFGEDIKMASAKSSPKLGHFWPTKSCPNGEISPNLITLLKIQDWSIMIKTASNAK